MRRHAHAFWFASTGRSVGFPSRSSRSAAARSVERCGRIYAGRIQGTGAVYALPNPASTEPELMIRAQPVDNAPVVAYADFWIADNGGDDGSGGSVFAADESGLIGELERVSHDDYGLVADRVRGQWIRVIYGYTPAGQARAGWVRLCDWTRSVHLVEEEQIRTRPVWFKEDPAGVGALRATGRQAPSFQNSGSHDCGGTHLTAWRFSTSGRVGYRFA